MPRGNMSLAVPDELRPAIVTPETEDQPRAREAGRSASGVVEAAPFAAAEESPFDVVSELPGNTPESGVWRSGSVKIAHVLAGDDGVEDVEVSVSCPHCDGAVLIDVANEDAFMTAWSLMAPTFAESLKNDPLGTPGVDAATPPPSPAREVSFAKELETTLHPVAVVRAMTSDVFTLSADTPLASVVAGFAERGVSCAIVLDEDGRPIGSVSTGDLLWAACRSDKDVLGSLADVRVQQVMNKDLFFLRADAALTRALDLFRTERAERIIVLSDNGKLLGSIMPQDLLAFLAERA